MSGELAKKLQHGVIRRKLIENQGRRKKALAELEKARVELAELVRRGRALTPPLEVTEMARITGVSRERLYELLRGLERDSRVGFNTESRGGSR